MESRLEDMSAIGRPLDFRFATNSAIAVVSVVIGVAFIVINLLEQAPFLDSVGAGVTAFFVSFFTWALAREVDPDHNTSAFIAVGLAILGLLFVDRTPLVLGLIYLILVLRIINRTVGVPVTVIDAGFALVLAGILVLQGYWVFGFICILAYIVEGYLSYPQRNFQFLFAIGLGIFTIFISTSSGVQSVDILTIPVAIIMMIVTLVFLFIIFTLRPILTTADRIRKLLDYRRVQLAMILTLLTVVLFAVVHGDRGVLALLPVWAVIISTILYQLYEFLIGRHRN